MNISERIIENRERKKIKQSEIANKLGIDQPNYSRLEKRGEKLTIEQLKQIANVLEVSIYELLGEPTSIIINEEVEKVKEAYKVVNELNISFSETIALYKELHQIHGKVLANIIEIEITKHFIFHTDIYIKSKEKQGFNIIDCFVPNPKEVDLEVLPITSYLISNNLVDFEKLDFGYSDTKNILAVLKERKAEMPKV